MKKIKQMLAIGALLLGSSAMQAQTVDVDLATGRDANGARIYWPNNDDTWQVLVPGTFTYQPVAVGTGYEPNTDTRFHAIATNTARTYWNSWNGWYDDPIGWLTPHPTASGDVDPVGVTGQGDYKFRTAIYVGAINCKKVVSARIIIKKLTGCRKITKIVINGTTIIDPDPSLYQQPPSDWLEAFGFLGHLTINPYPNGLSYYNGPSNLPPNYVIPVNAAILTPGYHTLEIHCEADNMAGMMVDAKLEFTYGVDPSSLPRIDLTGSSRFTCAVPQPIFSIVIPNGGSNTFTGTLEEDTYPFGTYTPVSGVNPFYINGSSVQINVNPTTVTNYRITITNDQTGCSSSTTYSMYPCTVAPPIFGTNIGFNDGTYTVTANPLNPDELSLQDFVQKWTLQELDPVTLNPIQSVEEPSCWEIGAGEEMTFEGFYGATQGFWDAYVAAGKTLNCPGTSGTFLPDHVYKISRSVKSLNTNWETYSTIVRPGAKPEFTITLNEDGGVYTLEAVPVNAANEENIEGFGQKWHLERINPSNMTTIYELDGPLCWNGDPGTKTTFDGFDPVNSDYEAKYAIGPIEIPCDNADKGVFLGDDLYKLTRYVKGSYLDWTSYSVTFRPSEALGKTGPLPVKAAKTDQTTTSSSNISVYPNPGNGLFTISVKGTGTMDVYDALGKKIKHITLHEDQSSYEVDLSGLAKGMYTVHMHVNNKLVAKKIVLE